MPYGKSRAAQVSQPWVLHRGPRTPGVSPAAQVSQLSRGFLVQVPPGSLCPAPVLLDAGMTVSGHLRPGRVLELLCAGRRC